MHSSLSSGERLAKGATACLRCRRGKQKCDPRNSSSYNCEGVCVPCMTYHSLNRSKVPRNYVSKLEAEIENLTRQNRELIARSQSALANADDKTPHSHHTPGSLANSDTSSHHVQDLTKSISEVVVEPPRQPRFLGQSGGITLAKLVISAIRIDALPSPLVNEPRSYNPSSSPMVVEASLPPRHAADHLVDVYFQYHTPHLPIVMREMVEEAVESAYRAVNGQESPERAVDRDIFLSFMIFAMALCDVSNSSGGRPAQSEGCFRSAIGLYENVVAGLNSNIEILRTILLLAQFVALYPSRGSLWHLTGIALRLSIDIGMHWENEDQTTDIDPTILYDRRRLWYSTYQLDRILCITLGRPFGIIDESIRVPLPNPWAIYQGTPSSESTKFTNFDIHNQRAHNHLFSLSMLESEIKHVQHSQLWTPKIAYPRANYAAWFQDIQPRLEEWFATIPQINKAHPSSIFANQAYWDYLYENALILLYRANSTGAQASPEITLLFFKASCRLIGTIKTLQREGKVDILWKFAHHLFMAGLGVIYSLWQSKEVRDENSIGSSISTLQSCTSTLSAVAESLPGVSGCRDAFETLSSATVDCLVNNKAAELHQNRKEFEKQAEDLLLQLQPKAMKFPGISSADSFIFSEMFRNAAQWPDYQHSRFVEIGYDRMVRGGSHIF